MSCRRNNTGHDSNRKKQSTFKTSDLDHIVALLCDGDITKRQYVLWNVSTDEIEEYLDIQLEKVKFRKVILAYLGVKDKPQNDLSDEEYLESISHFKLRKGTGKHG